VLWPLLVLEGRWAEARTRWAEETEGPIFRIYATPHVGLFARAQGNREWAWRLVRDLLPDGPATEPGRTLFMPMTQMQRLAVQLALDDGDLPKAREWLEAHGRWLAWSGAVRGRSEGHHGRAAYHRAAGDGARAYEHAERALAHATEPRQPLALLAIHRLIGELDIETGRHEEAAHHLDAALALAEACEAPYERALTLLAIAQLRIATGETQTARTLLEDARTICEPLGAQPALARADALLARLPADPAHAYPAGLSAREVEVLRLVAQGMTDRQVAEQLFLSPRTINQHLRSIYNKLGVSSRAAATHFAVERGIA
jgi:ATP/maltotriose-dependent transcriptional regulator MalT